MGMNIKLPDSPSPPWHIKITACPSFIDLINSIIVNRVKAQISREAYTYH